MKKINLIIKSIFVLAIFSSLAFSQCGNGARGTPSGLGVPSAPVQGGADPIVPYSGNEYKEISDLPIWGGVGKQLVWTRYANSRATSGTQLFGMGHYWAHSFQYQLLTQSANSSGQAQVKLVLPEGSAFVFTQTDPSTWTGTLSCEYKLIPSGSDLVLLTKDSEQYFFKKFTSGSTFYYLMTEITDAMGNKFPLTYNASKQLVKVAEPAGRSLNVTYKTLTANKVDFAGLGTLTAAPAAGTWTEIPVTLQTAYRYVRLLSADGAYGNIAEVEFYDNLGNKLTGNVISSDSAALASSALDGDPSTGFVSGSFSGSYVGLDLGTAKKISKMRFLAVAGKEALMKPTKWGYSPVKVQGANQAPASVSVISKVSTSDGREINYTYENYNDSSVPYVFPTLTEAVYGDGTKATYGYAQIFSGQRPMITDWNDVRYGLRQPRYKTVYQSERASTVLGMVDKQINVETGGTITQVGVFAGRLHEPTLTFANGSVLHQVMSSGILTAGYDGNNNKTTYVYDANGFLAKETDALGRVTSYVNSLLGNHNKITYPDGSVEEWTRNSLESILTYKDTLGRITSYTRDPQNRITRVDYPDASYETFAYNAYSEAVQKRQRNGGLSTFTYDSRGLLTQSEDALHNVTQFGHDSSDRVTSITDARNNVVTKSYNERGLVLKITNSDGTFKSFTYNALGDPLSETNELGNTTSMTYDIFRHVTSVTDSLNRTTTSTYAPNVYNSKPIEVVLSSGKKSTFTYDKEWNVLTKTAGTGSLDAATTVLTYDKVYNVLTAKDARGQTTTMTYDLRNRKLTQKDPLGNITTWTYDFAGNNLTMKDALNRVTTNTFDLMNRLKTTTDAKNQTTSYEYDLSGNLLSMTDAKTNVYSFEYDLLNRKTAMIYPDSSREKYGYDQAGNPTSYTTRSGAIKTAIFDNRNRETSNSWSDGTTTGVTRTFDVMSRLVTSDNGQALCSYGYNNANELISETTTVNGQVRTVSYMFDQDGNRSSVTYPDGSVVTYGYTGRNQIASVNSGGIITAYSYDLNGNRIGRSLENGTNTTYAFDNASRLTSITDKNGPTIQLSTVYALNAVGNRTNKTQGGASETYAFDAIDQVTGVNYSATSRNVSYNYDATGNRMSVIDNGVSTAYGTNNLNQYTSVGGAAQGYDGNGNLTSGQGIFLYDAMNRLTKSIVGVNTVEFTYDSKNRVVKRSTNGVPLFLIYDGWSLIEERNGSGTLLQKYINGAVVDEILVKVSTIGSVYYHQDGLGSTTQLTDSTGNVVEKYSYDIFGKATITNASGTVLPASLQENRLMFTGREWINEVGLYDYRNRVYSCELGRFLQTDPIRFDGKDVNIYRYCGNNGVNSIDPLGLWSASLCPDNMPSNGLGDPLGPFDPNSIPTTPPVPPQQRGNNNNSGDSGIDNGDGTKTYKNNNKHYSDGGGVIGVLAGFLGVPGLNAPFSGAPTTQQLMNQFQSQVNWSDNLRGGASALGQVAQRQLNSAMSNLTGLQSALTGASGVGAYLGALGNSSVGAIFSGSLGAGAIVSSLGLGAAAAGVGFGAGYGIAQIPTGGGGNVGGSLGNAIYNANPNFWNAMVR